MKRQSVSSSNLLSVGYDAATKILEIEFHSGSVYQYTAVPLSEHDALMSATSQGSYFNAHIKGVYSYSQVS